MTDLNETLNGNGKAVRAVLFDLDGTLVDSAPDLGLSLIHI